MAAVPYGALSLSTECARLLPAQYMYVANAPAVFIMPRWAEPQRHTVVGLCVCVSVRRTLTKRQRARC